MISPSLKKTINFSLAIIMISLVLFPSGIRASEDVPTQEPVVPEVDAFGNLLNGAPYQQDQSNAPQATTSHNILCYSTQTTFIPCDRVTAIFTSGVTVITSLAAFPADLSPYDVVYIGYGEGDTLNAKSDQLQTYVQDGGGLIVSQPNLVGPVDIYPPGFEMTVTDVTWPGFPNAPGPDEFTSAGASHPLLNGLNPGDLSGNFDTIPLSTLGPGWSVLAKSVSHPNMALAVGTYGSGRLVFHSGNINSGSVDPGSDAYVRQMIDWVGAGGPAGPDMQITDIEVTQAIQDLNNSVDLVAGKRTYARLHVSSPMSISDVTANLSGSRSSVTLYPTLLPGNPGADITILPSPDRGQINDSFWFELPSSWLGSGNVTLTARLDPAGAKNDPNLSNNQMSVTVNLLDTPPLRLRLFNVSYDVGTTTYLAATTHLNQLESWLRRAYPIPSLQVNRSTFNYPTSGLPDVDDLNSWLALIKLLRIIFTGEDSRTVYYGMVDDGGGFMRGKALGIPGTIAAGPTGTDNWGWDYDGSYGDWYGGHEIAHTRNRYHAEYCGAGGGVAYPYPSGKIGGPSSDPDKFYGFDVNDRTVYGPNWRDVMTYCANQWVSDFTYEGIRSYLDSLGLARLNADEVTADQFLVVLGMADLITNTADLENVYLISETATIPLPMPGDWTLALVNSSGDDLATHAFMPQELTDAEEESGAPAVINEVVPFVPGTVKVEIRYQGEVKASRMASANAPVVEITSPQDGFQLKEGPFIVSWTSFDPDGDSLTYSLLHSNNSGETWEVLSTGLNNQSLAVNTQPDNPNDHSIELDTRLLPGGSTSRLRVVASDGFLSGMDTTGDFSTPLNAPDAIIESPEESAFYYPGQLVVLQGSAYDLEDGLLGGSALQWESDLDDTLGSGTTLSTVDLSTGTHTISLTATDSNAMSDQEQITIHVLAGDVPEPTNLDVSPSSIAVVSGFGDPAEMISMTIRSSSGTPLDWTASEDSSWISLSGSAGTSPSDLQVTIDPDGLLPGVYMDTLTFTSQGADNSPVEVPVTLEVTGSTIYLPLIMK